MLNLIETVFLLSLAVAFVLVLLIVYHFNQRIAALEHKTDALFEVVQAVVEDHSEIEKNFAGGRNSTHYSGEGGRNDGDRIAKYDVENTSNNINSTKNTEDAEDANYIDIAEDIEDTDSDNAYDTDDDADYEDDNSTVSINQPLILNKNINSMVNVDDLEYAEFDNDPELIKKISIITDPAMLHNVFNSMYLPDTMQSVFSSYTTIMRQTTNNDINMPEHNLDDNNVIELNIDESNLDIDEPNLDIDEPNLDIDEPNLDIDEPNLDIDDTELDIDDTKLDIDDTKLDIDEMGHDIDEMKHDIDEMGHDQDQNIKTIDMPEHNLDDINTPIDISKDANISTEPMLTDNFEYTKLSVHQLRLLAVSRQLIVDASKLKKTELVKLLSSTDE